VISPDEGKQRLTDKASSLSTADKKRIRQAPDKAARQQAFHEMVWSSEAVGASWRGSIGFIGAFRFFQNDSIPSRSLAFESKAGFTAQPFLLSPCTDQGAFLKQTTRANAFVARLVPTRLVLAWMDTQTRSLSSVFGNRA
jgi:hypothetical protein